MWEKRSSGKRAKKRFLYSHEYRDTKRGVETRETSFPETHEMCEQKMLGKISSGKRGEKRFFYSHEYRDQKRGEKTRETILPATPE